MDFSLSKELIAQEPVHPRDHARLLVYDRGDKSIKDDYFYNLANYLEPKTTLVINNSKVENCRWLFNDGKTEVFVLEKLDAHTVRALIRPGKKFRQGKTVQLTDWLSAEVTAVAADGQRTLKLNVPHDDPRLAAYEHIPLPFYINQNDKLALEYQTVYAKPLGSKAAPTAGLHFTGALLKAIAKNHPVAEVTLHVGLGTFAPLTDQNLETGRLHEEWFSIDTDNATKLKEAKHLTAVGTTSVRTLETLASRHQLGNACSGSTDIFIRQGYDFKAVDSLITNFHLPGTSLLMLVATFMGSEDELLHAYNHAITQKYRFYSFGDAMLVL